MKWYEPTAETFENRRVFKMENKIHGGHSELVELNFNVMIYHPWLGMVWIPEKWWWLGDGLLNIIHPHDFITKLSPPPVLGVSSGALLLEVLRPALDQGFPSQVDRFQIDLQPAILHQVWIRKTRWNHGKLGASHGDVHGIYHDIWQWGCVWLRLTNQNLRALKQPNNKHQDWDCNNSKTCDVRKKKNVPLKGTSEVSTSGWSQKHGHRNIQKPCSSPVL